MQSEIFIQGPIPNALVGEHIAKISTSVDIGAQSLFLGQIRADKIGKHQVVAIDYSTYQDMALKVFEKITSQAKEIYDLSHLIIRHSLGVVKVGEASLLIITASKHRRASLEALDWTVEAIKKEIPVFGKEIFETGEHQWKVNK